MPDTYKLAKDSPVVDAQVDKLHFRDGRDDEHALTKDQVTRLEAIGAKLTKTTPSGS